jgi:diguanylate cyclase (GGDEF)-like protein
MRIALVDPSRAVQRAMTNLIAEDGNEVVAFGEGRAALDHIGADATIAALITSVQLPDISGLELCAAARRLASARRPLVIIVMSSSEDFELVVKALDNGADDFIHKPPFAEELRARLRAANRLIAMQHELIRRATIDALTGLLNRRAFFEDAAAACQAANAGRPLSAILFDLDHFKSINDGRGHDAGDVVLAAVGAATKMAASGLIGRLGGEEFCVLAHCDLAEAVKRAEVLRAYIKDLRFPECATLSVTCSLGVAAWQADDTIDSLLRRADVAMYEAKSAGRDCVIAADHRLPAEPTDDWRGSIRQAARVR